jgi:flagellar motor switch protein FliN/FliY
MAFLEGIEIEVAAVLGSTMLPIREIVKMSRGAMIPHCCWSISSPSHAD